MKHTVLAAAVILIALPLLPWTHANAQAQTTDQHGWIGTETVKTRFGDFEFKNGYPTAEATDKLYELRTFNRAVESYRSFSGSRFPRRVPTPRPLPIGPPGQSPISFSSWWTTWAMANWEFMEAGFSVALLRRELTSLQARAHGC